MSHYGSLLDLMGLYSSFCIFMDSNGSLSVLIDPCSSLWILIGLICYLLLSVFICPCESS